MDIKIGDYVRTKYGIAKYIDNEVKSLKLIVIDRYIAYDHLEGYENVISQSEIIKSSSNIIDLIEDGDYVNGYLIEKVYDVFEISHHKLKEAHIRYADENFISQLYDTQIKSIVTKEQFDNMEYKI